MQNDQGISKQSQRVEEGKRVGEGGGWETEECYGEIERVEQQ